MKGRVLIVAGSDSSGGAGIQADIKTVTALGGYAATAITAVTAQDTHDIHAIHCIPVDIVTKQMEVVLSDIGTDCIKTGMLHSAAIIEAVGEIIAPLVSQIPIVVDPLMIAKGGRQLLKHSALETLKRVLLLDATVATPNVPEAEALTGMTIRDLDDMKHAAEMIHTLGPKAVLLKGGHLRGERSNVVHDILHDENGFEVFESPRLDTRHTHGTGCTLASAIAVSLAQGMSIRDSAVRARNYVLEAIRSAPQFGSGFGPINHGHPLKTSAKAK